MILTVPATMNASSFSSAGNECIGVAAVPVQVVALGRRDDEGVEAVIDHGQNGCSRGPPSAAHGAEERETHAELIEELLPGIGQVGTRRRELAPVQSRTGQAPIGCQTVLNSMSAVIS